VTGPGLVWDESGSVPVLRWHSAPAGIRVAFTSRQGGASRGPFSSLNLGALTADQPDAVAENRRRAVTAVGGDPEAATMAWQVHGPAVREVDGRSVPGRFTRPGAEPFPQSDGLVTSLPQRPLTLLAADCLPIAIAAEAGGRIAVLHAGWRGLLAGIVERGVAAVGLPAVAAVGPSAGPCCYAVGADVAVRLQARFGPHVMRSGRADLWLAARGALEAAGVSVVEVACECTICAPQRYFSHRRDRGVTGRQGVVGLVA
jgi:YfiH family protein